MDNPCKLNRKAQVVLETALILVAVFIFIVGIIRAWAWFVGIYRDRWQSYSQTRASAGMVNTYDTSGRMVDDGYTKPALNLTR